MKIHVYHHTVSEDSEIKKELAEIKSLVKRLITEPEIIQKLAQELDQNTSGLKKAVEDNKIS